MRVASPGRSSARASCIVCASMVFSAWHMRRTRRRAPSESDAPTISRSAAHTPPAERPPAAVASANPSPMASATRRASSVSASPRDRRAERSPRRRALPPPPRVLMSFPPSRLGPIGLAVDGSRALTSPSMPPAAANAACLAGSSLGPSPSCCWLSTLPSCASRAYRRMRSSDSSVRSAAHWRSWPSSQRGVWSAVA